MRNLQFLHIEPYSDICQKISVIAVSCVQFKKLHQITFVPFVLRRTKAAAAPIAVGKTFFWLLRELHQVPQGELIQTRKNIRPVITSNSDHGCLQILPAKAKRVVGVRREREWRWRWVLRKLMELRDVVFWWLNLLVVCGQGTWAVYLFCYRYKKL